MASTEDTVNQIIAEQRSFAQTAFGNAERYSNEASNAANSLFTPNIPTVTGDITFLPPDALVSPPPFDTRFVLPQGKPTLGPLSELITFEPESIPDGPERINPDDFFKVDIPTYQQIVVPPLPPELDDPLPPTTPFPQITVPADPELIELTEPVPPQINLPSTANTPLPSSPPAAPENLPDLFRNEFSGMSDQFRTKIVADFNQFLAMIDPEHLGRMATLNQTVDLLMTTGNGLPDNVLQGHFDQARRQIRAEAKASEDVARRTWARRGYLLPPGQQIAAYSRGREASSDRNANAAIDVARIQEETKQQNLRFGVQMGVQIRSFITNAAIQWAGNLLQINGQAITYANGVVRAVIDQFNALAARFQLEVEYFRSWVTYYDLQIRIGLTDLERYRAEAQVLQVKTEINRSRIELHRNKIEIEEQKIRLYVAQLEAQRQELERRRVILESFRAQIEGLRAQVLGQNASFSAYEAALRGETARLNGALRAYDVYRSEVTARTDRARLQAANSDAQGRFNANIVDRFRGELSAWLDGDVRAEQIRTDQELRVYTAGLENYRAELNNQVQLANLELRSQEARSVHERGAADIKLRGSVESARIFADQVSLRARTSSALAGTSASMASSALNALNTMSSLTASVVTNQ